MGCGWRVRWFHDVKFNLYFHSSEIVQQVVNHCLPVVLSWIKIEKPLFHEKEIKIKNQSIMPFFNFKTQYAGYESPGITFEIENTHQNKFCAILSTSLGLFGAHSTHNINIWVEKTGFAPFYFPESKIKNLIQPG